MKDNMKFAWMLFMFIYSKNMPLSVTFYPHEDTYKGIEERWLYTPRDTVETTSV